MIFSFFSLLLAICIQEDISVIFDKADKDKSGSLTVKEVQDVIDDIYTSYAQVELFLKNMRVKNVVDLLKDSKGNDENKSIEREIEALKSALSQVDS